MSDLSDPRVFFAAERTLLAWNRTGLTLMAFGFVLERFGLFLHILRQDAGHAMGLTPTDKIFGETPTPSYLKPLTGGAPTKTMPPLPATAKEKLLEAALNPAQRAGLDPNDPATRDKLIAYGLSPEDVDWYLSGAPAAGSRPRCW